MNSPAQSDRPWLLHAPDDDSDYIDLPRLWRAIWSRKWGILALVTGITLITALVLVKLPPSYRAVTSMMIESKGTQLLSFQPVYDSSGQLSEYLQTQLGLIQSREVTQRTVRNLNLTEHPDLDPRQQPGPLIDIGGLVKYAEAFFRGEEPLPAATLSEAEVFDLVTDALMRRSNAWVEGKSQLVFVSVEMGDSLSAAQAANAMANAYIESQLEAQMDATLRTSTWMNQRLTELRASLQEAEDRLQAYREAEGLVDVDGVATISVNELSLTGDRMIDARRQRAEAESQYRQVQSMRKAGWQRLASIPAVLGHPLIQQFKSEEARARAKVEELSRRYGDLHPTMLAARTELAAASASLQGQVEQVVAGIERNYQLAVANENSLRSSFNSNKEQIQDIARKEFQLRELQRDVDSNRTLYEAFMNRLRETSATADLHSSNARIVDQALPPKEPSKPRKKLILIFVFALAVLFSLGLALLLDALNNTFKSTEDIESKLNLPVLGIVPRLTKQQAKEGPHLFEQDNDKRFCEAIRTIRTGLMLGDMHHPRQVLVITSSVPDEGKSLVAVNLAFAVGQLQKVLLIDADLRRPTLARSFDLPAGTPGLANLMAGTAKTEDCIHRIGEVDMIPAGVVPPNPLELLASQRFAKFLEMAKGRYDRIIVDSPPSQAVSDAILLSSFANEVIYVVKAEGTAIPLVQKSIGQLLHSGASITGVVLNHVDVTDSAHCSGYYDYYGYSERQA